jgi:DMSO/TMAO reductase YedYZ heme-binding membrane subunit
LWLILTAGTIGGTLLFAMALTSFDVTGRWLGPRIWKWLHTTGIWFVSLQFLGAFARRCERGSLCVVLTAMMLAPFVVRFLAFVERRRRASRTLPESANAGEP